jgi:hypothetical protein
MPYKPQVEIRRGFFENESVEVEVVEITIFSSVVEIPLVCIAYVCHTAVPLFLTSLRFHLKCTIPGEDTNMSVLSLI